MKKRLVLVGLVSFLSLGLATGVLKKIDYSRFDLRYYLSAKQINFVRPGLDLEVLEITTSEEGRVSVVFTVSDDRGLPLDLDGVFTPGPIRARFILGAIPAGQDHYRAFTLRTQTSPITNESAVQPTSDSGGTFEQVSEGVYEYTFGTLLPEDDDPDWIHSVGIYSDRDLEEFGLGDQIDNDVVHFKPMEGIIEADEPAVQPVRARPAKLDRTARAIRLDRTSERGFQDAVPADIVEGVRDVVRTDSCNTCHNPLAIHGGFRRDVELCVMCHYQGVIDPDTGNSVDMAQMVHKIHRGAGLPSVEAGTPYRIIGFRQSVHDYSHAEFPQDIRNCHSCHSDDATQQAAYVLRPRQDACGSCHDDVDFVSGEGHAGGPVLSDMFCSSCHFPEGELEFDASIIGAHTIPAKSEQLEGINIEIVSVTDSAPGEAPTVHYTLKTNEGEDISPASFPFFNFILAGPTTDYAMRVSERAVEASVPVADGYAYTFNTPIPADATGTFTMGAEAFRNVLLNPDTTKEFSHRETAENPVFYFAVTDPEPVPRRMVVSDAKCESCHENLALHGSIRHNTDYCVTCHRPGADDSAVRPEEELPARNIHFKMLIHRIHMGEELENDYTVFGFMGSTHNYNDVVYPGDLRDCTACHVEESYEVPSGGVLATTAPGEFFTPIPPDSASCLGCHDGISSAAHAFLNIAPFGESCATCHGPGKEFAVAKEHARP